MKHIIITSLFAMASVLNLSAQKIEVGSYTFKDGSVYTGSLYNGKPNGTGRTVFKNGDSYEGDYVKGKRDGSGIYNYANGERYDGQWYQNQRHGRGTFFSLNNNRYEGLWYRDSKEGSGTMFYYNGDTYVGEWKDDLRMVRERTPIRMALITRATGWTTRKQDTAFSTGMTVRNMKAACSTTFATGRARISIQTATIIAATGKRCAGRPWHL